MENKLEQLLNSLIEKGWKPRQHTNFVRCNYCDTYSEFSFETENESWIWEHTLRELVSKESNLWQFVCENGMVENKYKDRRYYNENKQLKKACFDDDYEYRIIESALKDESELEEFLLSNIVIKDEE